MSIAFAANLSALRREKNITQKVAAENLGISQALLSHYEKGIRECNLDFVRRAAEYYGVTADFLLGITANRHSQSDFSDFSDMGTDNQVVSKTVLRALMFLMEQTENENDEVFFNDFFSLAIEKYMALSKGDLNLCRLCDVITPDNKDITVTDDTASPLCIKTIDSHAKKLIAQNITEMLG